MIKEMESMSCEERLMDGARDEAVAGEGLHVVNPREIHVESQGAAASALTGPRTRGSRLK